MPRPPFPSQRLAAEIAALLAAQPNRFTQDQWDVHGITLTLHTDHPTLRAVAAHLLDGFSAPGGTGGPAVRLCFTHAAGWAIPPQAQVLPPSSNEVIDVQASYGLTGTFARTGGVNYFELAPLGGAAYDMRAGQALAAVAQPDDNRPWIIGHLLLMPVLLELLRGQGLYWVHAAGVAHQGQAALVVGQTGAGKTTTCLALAHGGFQFLSEDRVFVRAEDAGLRLLAFPKHIAVTAATAQLLPWLAQRLPQPFEGRRKQEIAPRDLLPNALAAEARPGVILFSQVRGAGASTARPLAQATALQRLLPNSLLASQPEVSAQHFDALARLVEQSRCYELDLGPEVAALPELVRGLLS